MQSSVGWLFELRLVCCRELFKLCQNEAREIKFRPQVCFLPEVKASRKVEYWYEILESHLLHKSFLLIDSFIKKNFLKPFLTIRTLDYFFVHDVLRVLASYDARTLNRDHAQRLCTNQEIF